MTEWSELLRVNFQDRQVLDVTSSSFVVKCGPSNLLMAIMTATMSLPFMMGMAMTFLVWYSVSSSTKSLKWGLYEKKSKDRVFDCIQLLVLWPCTTVKLPVSTLMNTLHLSINAASKGFPLSENSSSSLLHSTYCSSCAAGVINCVPPGVKNRKSGSLTAKKEQKPAESDAWVTEIGDKVHIWVRQIGTFCSDVILFCYFASKGRLRRKLYI